MLISNWLLAVGFGKTQDHQIKSKKKGKRGG